ncbi:MerR HTH family regulatory protein [Cohaesibacter gelatinilyticus]|uniref:MerR HTH family regulatory protein n=1 Tax=Cohaesibacter gelatinilyticus TaxID=372072 RepID=A0A285NCZ9_9HYPH|nr:MerR HTH family regulatory protein [Cohaesibacter gelatinilyticus]
MRKSPDAFRTISEVAQELDLPQHVLRFWETRFSQIKPMKRGGGRRYYRPDDVELLRGIRHLLYGEGYTIKGVQRILKEQGVRHVIEAFPGHINVPETEIGEATHGDDIGQPEVQAIVSHGVQQLQDGHNSGNMLAPEGIETNQATAVIQPDPIASSQTAPIVQAPVPQVAIQAPQTAQVTVPQSEQSTATQESGTVSVVPPASPQNPVQQPVPALASQQEEIPLFAQTSYTESNTAQGLNNSAAPTSVITPHTSQPTPMPQDLSQGEPVFQQGQEAAFSVEAGRNTLLQENKSGFFSRLRGKGVSDDMVASQETSGLAGMPRDDVRRLQSTLFELLECKRILDQARNSS